MSKAFTSEENEDDGALEAPALPPGVKNYMTRAGAQRMRAELAQLEEDRRVSAGSDVGAQARLAKVERRMRFLVSRLERAAEIDPLQQPHDRVLFGATVTLCEANGHDAVWRIVGLDETDLEKGWISWMSPLAQALLEKRRGEQVHFRSRLLTVQDIVYTEF